MESLSCIPETNTTLWMDRTSLKKQNNHSKTSPWLRSTSLLIRRERVRMVCVPLSDLVLPLLAAHLLLAPLATDVLPPTSDSTQPACSPAAMVWIFLSVPPPLATPTVETLVCNVMVSGGGVFGRCLVHEGGISALFFWGGGGTPAAYGSSPGQSANLSCSCGNAGSLTCCTTAGAPGISTLTTETLQSSWATSARWGHNKRSEAGRGPSSEQNHAGTVILDFWPPELREIYFCHL